MDDTIQRDKMLNTNIPKLISFLAIPTIISMLVTSIYNLADTYFVSELGKSAVAAVAVVFSLQTLIQALGYTIGIGAGSIISRSLGANNYKKAHQTVSQAMLMGLCVGLFILLSGVFFNGPIMKLFGTTETSHQYAMDYAKWIFYACPFMICAFIMNNVLRNEGKAKFSMIGLTFGGVLNIVLDPICINYFKMGVSGAGLATMISQIVSFCILLSFYLFKKSSSRISVKYLSNDYKSYLHIIVVGLPTLFRQGFATIANTILSHLGGSYDSDTVVAALGIVSKIYMIIRNIIIGIGQGYQPVLGFNYGAKRYDRIKKAFKFTLICQTAFCLTTTIIVLLLPKTIVTLFKIEEQEVITLGVFAIRCLAIALPLLGFSTIVNQSLQIMGYKKSATFLASCRQGVVYIPVIFILNWTLREKGLCLTQPLSDFLTSVITIYFFFYLMRILNEGEKETCEQINCENS